MENLELYVAVGSNIVGLISIYIRINGRLTKLETEQINTSKILNKILDIELGRFR